MQEANRLKRLPPYLFTIVDQKKREVAEKGVDVIDLSMGSPDLPAPKHAIDELCRALKHSPKDPAVIQLVRDLASKLNGSFGPLPQELGELLL